MTLTSRILAGGDGWQISDVRCGAGPKDSPFEEQHDRFCMAVVLDGTFGYRSTRGSAVLAPGALLLGNPGDCYECSHRHSVGDRCLSLQFDAAFYESVVRQIPGATRLALDRPSVSSKDRHTLLLARADGVLENPGAAEEFVYELVSYVAATSVGARSSKPFTASNAGRIETVVHEIEKHADRPQPLARLAAQAGMSPFHFLREFKRVVGTTPHQFVLSLRLRRAAARLRHSRDPVLQIAFEAGFSDLSEFNRRFRRLLGTSPRAYRASCTADIAQQPGGAA
jgi:AraC-like DNA-binding protein